MPTDPPSRPSFKDDPEPMVALPPGAALPGAWEAGAWEAGACFRETFLLLCTDLRHNDAFRAVGTALYDIATEAAGSPLLPYPPDPLVRHQLAAVAADLRHLQGFLGSAEQNDPDDREEARLLRLARRTAQRIEKLAAALEAALFPPAPPEAQP